MIIKNEPIDQICKAMSRILMTFGFQKVTINDHLYYACGGRFYRLVPMCENRTILLEAAESLAWVKANGYEDAAWYDLPETLPISDKETHKLLERFRGDIVLYFSADNFDERMRSDAYQKTNRDGAVIYSHNGTDVQVYFDENSCEWRIRIQKQNKLYERVLSPVIPDKTVQELKSFVKQHT